MHVIGGLALAVLIVLGGYAGASKVMDGVTKLIPQQARQRASAGGRKLTRSVAGRASAPAKRAAEPLRHVFARPMAEARATNWLEGKRTARARREARRETRPPRMRTMTRAAAATARVPASIARRIPKPAVAINLPGVTDQKPSHLAAVPDPAPATTTRSVPPVTERTSTMSALTRPAMTPDHAALNARVSNFEPESDGDLIGFMRGEAAGIQAYAEALEQLAEHLVSGVGLDPAAVRGITDYSQAVTECAAIMARANAQFQTVYQGVRETVANGTVMPHQGRWITGESA